MPATFPPRTHLSWPEDTRWLQLCHDRAAHSIAQNADPENFECALRRLALRVCVIINTMAILPPPVAPNLIRKRWIDTFEQSLAQVLEVYLVQESRTLATNQHPILIAVSNSASP